MLFYEATCFSIFNLNASKQIKLYVSVRKNILPEQFWKRNFCLKQPKYIFLRFFFGLSGWFVIRLQNSLRGNSDEIGFIKEAKMTSTNISVATLCEGDNLTLNLKHQYVYQLICSQSYVFESGCLLSTSCYGTVIEKNEDFNTIEIRKVHRTAFS